MTAFKKRKGSVILDVGCGDSGDRVVGAQRGFITYGIDLYPISLRNKQGFLFGNANALPFADDSFDAVICHAVLSLLSPTDRVKFYHETARVLRPTGVLCIIAYSFADGWAVNVDGEAPRISSAGFHRQRKGFFVRCRDTCSQHGADRASVNRLWQPAPRLADIENERDFWRDVYTSAVATLNDLGVVTHEGDSELTVADRIRILAADIDPLTLPPLPALPPDPSPLLEI